MAREIIAIPIDDTTRRFLRRLAYANAVVLILILLLYLLGIAPNPPEVRELQIPRFIEAVALMVFSANFTVISLYFIIRFWRR